MSIPFTAEELAKYDGRDNKPIYISVKGKVYDCSSARQFYGPGSPYEIFAGKEATRCLAKMIIGADEANAGWGNLSDENLATLNDWIEKYEMKYPIVGYFVPDPDFITRGDAFSPEEREFSYSCSVM